MITTSLHQTTLQRRFSSISKFYFQQNTRMEQYQKKQHFVDISKHFETLLHLPVVAREATGLIKLATKTHKI